MNLLDSEISKLDAKIRYQVDIISEDDSEVLDDFGGPCRGRTYGPLIKSECMGMSELLASC